MTILLQHRPVPAVAQGSPLVIFQLVGVQGKPNRKRVISARFLLARPVCEPKTSSGDASVVQQWRGTISCVTAQWKRG
jgi:hypothetical protein